MILSTSLLTPTQVLPGNPPPRPGKEAGREEDPKFGAPNKHITPGQSAGGESTGQETRGANAQNSQPNTPQPALTESEIKMIEKLKDRDMEVKRHEQAHLTAAGGLARSRASFQYQTGPDGKRYAIGGEVSIDMGQEGNPAETLRKMQVVQKAATAPSQPSAKDMAVAAKARQVANEARADLAELQIEAAQGPDPKQVISAAESRAAAESYSAVMKIPENNEIDVMA